MLLTTPGPPAPGEGASNPPALARAANSQGVTGANLATAAPAARPIASTASATTPTRGTRAGAPGSSAYSNRVKNARTSSDTAVNRRNHPRTVDTGRPTAAAIRR